MASEPIYNAIKVLREELERLNYVIKMLEGLAAGRPRRGRPPENGGAKLDHRAANRSCFWAE